MNETEDSNKKTETKYEKKIKQHPDMLDMMKINCKK